jgi:uncharacterized membrane protein
MELGKNSSTDIAVFLVFWAVMAGIAFFAYSIVYFNELGMVAFWAYILSIALAMLISRRQTATGLILLFASFLTKDWLIFGSDAFQRDYIYSFGVVCFLTLVLLIAYVAIVRKLNRILAGSSRS